MLGGSSISYKAQSLSVQCSRESRTCIILRCSRTLAPCNSTSVTDRERLLRRFRGRVHPADTGDMSLEGDSLFEKQTKCILLTFLKEKTFVNRIVAEEICKLEKIVTEVSDDDDDDGIQTDGHCASLYFFRSDLCREIGVRLALMGDGLDQGINHNVVEGFIQAHENNHPQEDGTITLSTIIDGLTDQRTTVIQDMPQERRILLLTLWLLEKTVLEQPRLLPRIFRTTVQYITTKLQNYINQLGGWEHLH
ncbi:uncharacterized protein LOC116983675 isoform X2 [Amblyraja radiata]|uniref:uncharacterized protein LOC116983675 isoform X2 n=1 Tax=Amblyraja radiata TaxID=386614 RepID=UPI00140351F4|nr:uncharacterized protein LOC116983675 isoform X2 [Amblyraja radiata]